MDVLAPPAGKPRDVTWTVAGVLGLLIISSLAGIPLTLTVLQNRESDALVIDIAGRQRMLLERYMKEVLLSSQGIESPHRHTRDLLEERLQALISGGSTAADVARSRSLTFPPVQTDEIRLALLEQQRRLREFTAKAEAFLRMPRDAAYAVARDELLKENAALLQTANEAVALMTRHSEARMQRMIRWEILVVVLVVIVAAMGTWRFLKAERELSKSQAVAMEALRQSDAVKSSLLSSVSHELRTPLTAIKSMLFSLRNDVPGSPSRLEFLKSIDEQVDYLNRLVGNLLDMSRLEAGMLRPHREWHVVDELTEAAIRRVDVLMGNRPLEVSLSAALPPVYVDGVQIQQVLVNLLDNAAKFSSPGTPIRMTASLSDSMWEVSVSNTGDGIPSEELDRIFDRFFRGRSRRSATSPGTGLGLAICKAIVEAHGGRISAASLPGGETTIRFWLPLAAPVHERTDPDPQAAGRTA